MIPIAPSPVAFGLRCSLARSLARTRQDADGQTRDDPRLTLSDLLAGPRQFRIGRGRLSRVRLRAGGRVYEPIRASCRQTVGISGRRSLNNIRLQPYVGMHCEMEAADAANGRSVGRPTHPGRPVTCPDVSGDSLIVERSETVEPTDAVSQQRNPNDFSPAAAAAARSRRVASKRFCRCLALVLLPGAGSASGGAWHPVTVKRTDGAACTYGTVEQRWTNAAAAATRCTAVAV